MDLCFFKYFFIMKKESVEKNHWKSKCKLRLLKFHLSHADPLSDTPRVSQHSERKSIFTFHNCFGQLPVNITRRFVVCSVYIPQRLIGFGRICGRGGDASRNVLISSWKRHTLITLQNINSVELWWEMWRCPFGKCRRVFSVVRLLYY